MPSSHPTSSCELSSLTHTNSSRSRRPRESSYISHSFLIFFFSNAVLIVFSVCSCVIPAGRLLSELKSTERVEVSPAFTPTPDPNPPSTSPLPDAYFKFIPQFVAAAVPDQAAASSWSTLCFESMQAQVTIIRLLLLIISVLFSHFPIGFAGEWRGKCHHHLHQRDD